MIVYVESNFVLEVALAQEQAAEAEVILRLAEQGRLTLVCPAFALSEPFAAARRLGNQLRQAYTEMQRQTRELARSGASRELAAQLQPLLAQLVGVEQGHVAALTSVVDRLLGAGESPPLDQAVFRQSITYRTTLGLQPQDAIIYAGILEDMRRRIPNETKSFLSRDVKGFEDPGIRHELQQYHCRFISDFANGLRYIESVLAGGPES